MQLPVHVPLAALAAIALLMAPALADSLQPAMVAVADVPAEAHCARVVTRSPASQRLDLWAQAQIIGALDGNRPKSVLAASWAWTSSPEQEAVRAEVVTPLGTLLSTSDDVPEGTYGIDSQTSYGNILYYWSESFPSRIFAAAVDTNGISSSTLEFFTDCELTAAGLIRGPQVETSITARSSAAVLVRDARSFDMRAIASAPSFGSSYLVSSLSWDTPAPAVALLASGGRVGEATSGVTQLRLTDPEQTHVSSASCRTGCSPSFAVVAAVGPSGNWRYHVDASVRTGPPDVLALGVSSDFSIS